MDVFLLMAASMPNMTAIWTVLFWALCGIGILLLVLLLAAGIFGYASGLARDRRDYDQRYYWE